MSTVIYTLAAYRARKQVKEDIKRRYGYSKLREYSAAQINTMAQMWIESTATSYNPRSSRFQTLRLCRC